MKTHNITLTLTAQEIALITSALCVQASAYYRESKREDAVMDHRRWAVRSHDACIAAAMQLAKANKEIAAAEREF